MKLRVSLATGSAFLSMVIRQTISQLRDLSLIQEDRDAAAAQRTLHDRPGLAIIDAGLFGGAAGAELKRMLAVRHEPSIVLDARASGVGEELAGNPSVHVVSGRQAGELDLGSIETDLRRVIDQIRKLDRSGAAGPLAALPRQVQRKIPYAGTLDLIVIGVSTGGPALLTPLMKYFDKPTLPTMIVQHMPESETAGYAVRLAEASGHAVTEAAHGPLPGQGTICVVRGGQDYRLVRTAAGQLHLRSAHLPDNPFHPNIDEILLSAAASGLAVGTAILTGMGSDGAIGAAALAERGYPVLAQRPDTCAVAGMPQSAVDCGAASAVQTPESIVATINKWYAKAAEGGSPIPEK